MYNITSIDLKSHSISQSYYFLPFRFKRFSSSKVLLVNDAGEYLFLSPVEFEKFINHEIKIDSQIFLNLKSKHFIYDAPEKLPSIIEILATKYRTKKAFLKNFTTLHMVVTTLRCNHRCNYCHASSQYITATKWDMDISTARKVVEMIFQSPSNVIKIEFQGGEPIVNFSVVKEIVNYANRLNKKAKKNLSFVLCTNLTLMNNDILKFLKKNNILISTSLDGPKHIHDANRIMRNGQSSYDLFIKKLELTRSILGKEKISALITVTRNNIYKLNSVIDEYIRLGFNGIFLRSLNPYGYANKASGKALQYKIEEFISSYKKAIEYILELNKQGTMFVEYFATIILSRILTPFSTGFMDLQSPAGAGILGVVYNFNGDVYPTDEARMLAASGDTHFRLGNVMYNTYKEIFGNTLLRKIVSNSCVEIIPMCHSCAYNVYCGADPIRAYSIQNDKNYIGHMPSSELCKKHKEIITFLLNLIENDDALDIFWSWITNKELKKVKLQ